MTNSMGSKVDSVNSNTKQIVDVFIIGGGINGVGIANDAAGRGLDVMLCPAANLRGLSPPAFLLKKSSFLAWARL